VTRRIAGKLTARDSQEIEEIAEATDREELDDRELMARLAQGQPEPLGELYNRHAAVIFRVLRRYVRGAQQSELEDLCQEVFLTAYEVAPRFKGEGTVRSWLCGIAIRLGRGRQRKRWVRGQLLSKFGGQSTGLAREVDDPIEGAVSSRIDLEKALAVLPKAQREVLLLHVIENLSGEEIAAALGISSKTVWTRLHRARQKMRVALSERGRRKP
jgi:RNA polymerase sigma-70 factor (ECF subfamily)